MKGDMDSGAREVPALPEVGELIALFRSIETIAVVGASTDTSKQAHRIPRYLPDGITVAHKTGLESGNCHDAGVFFTPHGDFLIVVLVKHNDKTAAAAKAVIGAQQHAATHVAATTCFLMCFLASRECAGNGGLFASPQVYHKAKANVA